MAKSVIPAAPAFGVIRLLPYTVGLWLGYWLLFLVGDLWVTGDGLLPLPDYLLNASATLGALGLVAWSGGHERLGRAFLPLVIGLFTVLPILSTYLLVPRFSRPGQPPLLRSIFSAEGLALRILPVLLMALLLVAWQYRLPQVIGYSLGSAALSFGFVLIPDRSSTAALGLIPAGSSIPTLYADLLVIAIQTLCLLIVGYCTTVLVAQIRKQRDDLATAVRRLRQYAGTLESLTISRQRNRTARELHDTLAHTLSGLTVQLEAVTAIWALDPARAQLVLAKAQESARQDLQETRQALTTLRAGPLEDLGLGAALRRLAEAAATRANLALELTVPDPLPPLVPDIERCLYRVAQEAVANVTYHADAHRLTVELTCGQALIELRIHDDGIGFTPAVPAPPGHFGLTEMQARAKW